MDIIRKLYSQEIKPSEQPFENAVYDTAFTQFEDLWAELKQYLTPEQYEAIKKIADNRLIMEFEYGREMFYRGFITGAEFFGEVFTDKMRRT